MIKEIETVVIIKQVICDVCNCVIATENTPAKNHFAVDLQISTFGSCHICWKCFDIVRRRINALMEEYVKSGECKKWLMENETPNK